MPPAAKDPEVKEESPVPLGRSARVEITDHRGPWVCLALKDPAACRFLERLAALDQRETTVTRAYRDRKVRLVLAALPDPWDQLESGALKERME